MHWCYLKLNYIYLPPPPAFSLLLLSSSEPFALPTLPVCLLLPELAHPKASLHGMKNFLPLPFSLLSPVELAAHLTKKRTNKVQLRGWLLIPRARREMMPFPSLPFPTLLPAPPLIFHVKLSPSSLHFWLLLLARFIHSFVTRPAQIAVCALLGGISIMHACSLLFLLLLVSSM